MPNVLSFHVATLSYFYLLVKMNENDNNHGTSIPRLLLSLFVKNNKHQNRFNFFPLMYLTGTGCHPQSIILSRSVDTFKAAVFSIKFYIIYPYTHFTWSWHFGWFWNTAIDGFYPNLPLRLVVQFVVLPVHMSDEGHASFMKNQYFLLKHANIHFIVVACYMEVFLLCSEIFV